MIVSAEETESIEEGEGGGGGEALGTGFGGAVFRGNKCGAEGFVGGGLKASDCAPFPGSSSFPAILKAIAFSICCSSVEFSVPVVLEEFLGGDFHFNEGSIFMRLKWHAISRFDLNLAPSGE